MKLSIVITDANILIDLIKLGLSSVLFESELFEFKTTDFVFEELYEEQKETLGSKIEADHFKILESDERDIVKIFEIKQEANALSIEDCSVWYFAGKLEGMVLTGDAQLRKHSGRSGLEVHSILYLFDQMLLNDLITHKTAIDKLSNLYKINKWLPKKEVEKRLKEWSEKFREIRK